LESQSRLQQSRLVIEIQKKRRPSHLQQQLRIVTKLPTSFWTLITMVMDRELCNALLQQKTFCNLLAFHTLHPLADQKAQAQGLLPAPRYQQMQLHYRIIIIITTTARVEQIFSFSRSSPVTQVQLS
jgi:hypothetical protein